MGWRTVSVGNKIILLVTAGFSLAAVIIGAYYLHAEKRQMELLLHKQARILFKQVQVARHWNAEHGGLYAMLRPGEKPNPYLYKVGPGKGKPSNVEPEISDSKGRHLGLINPALMTRQLAKESQQHTDVRFHLTSLKLINPNNTPDAFEKRALQAFEAGAKERIQYTEFDGKPYFRYMAPLHVEKACLKCHGFQGYRVGDIRGGLSVSIPMQNEIALYRDNRWTTLSSGIAVYLGIILLLIISLRRLIFRPLDELVGMASQIGSDGFAPSSLTRRDDELGTLARTLMSSDTAIRKQHCELELYARTMEQRSRIDALTSLYNRHHLMLEAPKLFAHAQRKQQPLILLLVDIDHFKHVNDTYGHSTGDRALRFTADCIRAQIREYDMLVRYGGEEFLLILPDTDSEEGLQTAERIRRHIEATPLRLDTAQAISLRVSIGIYCGADTTLDQAITHADEALYQAKQHGRNQVRQFTPASE